MGPKGFAKVVSSSPPISMERIPIGKSEVFDARWRDGTRGALRFAKDALPSGKRAQRGIPAISHPRRDVAFWRLADLFGWGDIVPETVLITLDGREASVEAWIAAEPLSAFRASLKDKNNPNWTSDLVAGAALVPKTQWLKLTLLDFVAGSRDRHANNVGIRLAIDDGTISHGLIAWDNPVCFGKTLRFYHNVFHKLLFFDRCHLDPLWDAFAAVGDANIREALSGLISPEEIEHACIRRAFVEAFPHRLPWQVVSEGKSGSSDFPTYEGLFTEALRGLSFFPSASPDENVVASS